MTDLLLEAEHYVEQYLKLFLPKTRCFHTFATTRFIVECCEELAAANDLPWPEAEALFMAAWFHGTAYCRLGDSRIDGSVRIAAEFLADRDLSSDFSDQVARLIRSTREGASPSSLLEKLLTDARHRYLALPHYAIISQFIRQELKLSEQILYSDEEWKERNIRVLTIHQYCTSYALEHWDHQKRVNLSELMSG
ncbi:MAG: hypothetical protein QM762_25760 [Chryseolinea sp.]